MMLKPFTFFPLLIFFALVSCTASKDPMRTPLRSLQKGLITEDSSFVYSLPYDTTSSHLVVQGYFSRYSHRNRAAIDFKMKRGTRILAARSGVVTRTKADGMRGGWKRKYRLDGNHIVIRHEDGSSAGYWHLQPEGVFVKTGDTIRQGQFIGLSGKTGYALFPHLHFSTWKNTANGQRVQTGNRFKTSKGNIYLRPFRRYTHQ
jgi:murein DD-endopeptidase MepM/ murein hydrolase activator NlpD